MGDEDGGDTGLPLDSANLLPGLQAQPGVQVGQGLIQQQHRGHLHQRPGDGHPLLLTAGHLTGLPVQKRIDLHQLGGFCGPANHLRLAGPVLALQVFQREENVLQNRHMGVQGIVLEHQTHPAVLRGELGHVLVPKENLSFRGGLEAADHVERRALAAARGAKQAHQLAIGNLIGKVVHGDNLAALLFVPVGKSLGQVL